MLDLYNKIRMVMASGSVLGYALQVLPVVCLAAILYAAIRLLLLKKKKAHIKCVPELLRLLFVCYGVGLLSLLILPANFWLSVYDAIFLGWWDEIGPVFQIGEINLVPSIVKCLLGELSLGSWVKTMLFGNVCLFLPLGFLLLFITQIRSSKRIVIIACVVPLCIETLQVFFGRSFDVDDLILNAMGIGIGAALAYALPAAASPDKKQSPKPAAPHTVYDPERYRAILRCSICTGEQVAGFKDRLSGKFIELDLIKNDQDLKRFMATYHLDSIEKEW